MAASGREASRRRADDRAVERRPAHHGRSRELHPSDRALPGRAGPHVSHLSDLGGWRPARRGPHVARSLHARGHAGRDRSARARGNEAMSYKLLSYQTGREARAGVLVRNTVYDVAKVTRTPGYVSALHLLEDWNKASRVLAQTSKAIASGKSRAKGVPLARTRLLAP